MQLPAYWWLLALSTLIQGAFFLQFCSVRLRGKGVQRLSRMAAIILFLSGLAGLAYGFVQRDPLFVLGQLCLLIIYHKHQQTLKNE